MPEVRLIDANALKKAFCDYCSAVDTDMQTCDGNCDTLRIIDEQPTIEPEVRRGEWIPIDGEPYAKCSYCGEKHYGCTTPYCDMCGAYMRKGGADNG